MKILRYYQHLTQWLKPNKVLVIYGARQVGKTTLLREFLDHYPLPNRLDSGENLRIREILSSSDFSRIKEYAQGYRLIAIDEAQYIPAVGQGLKILVDQVPEIHVVATGSSSFELSGEIGEPLTGRKTTLTLFPVSQLELKGQLNSWELRENLENYLIFGSYPEVLTLQERNEKKRLLRDLTESYLFKDILHLERIKHAKLLSDLLRLIAFQIGREVSLNELSGQLKIDVKTVGRYLDLLEKTFILYNLRGFSRNLRSEVTRKSKYYFIDNGIRNAVISNFNELKLRNDIGMLWENFLVTERLKRQAYMGPVANNYFWRTWSQQEIDFVEEREGKLFAFEFKWSPKKTVAPKEWRSHYPDSHFSTITPGNYLEFVT